MTAHDETDGKSGGPEAVRAAARRLRSIAEGAAVEEEPAELIRIANIAASTIVGASQNAYSPEQTAQFADNLAAALTVLRFGALLGGDPAGAEAAKAKVRSVVELFEMALEFTS